MATSERFGKSAMLRKLWRYAVIYGPRRALTKAMGRLRIGFGTGRGGRSLPEAAFVGCGQFAFSTIAYFLKGHARFTLCYDIDSKASASFSRIYGAEPVASFDAIRVAAGVNLVYIASNHASHADYAIAALNAGKRVYVEKPVAVSHHQLAQLSKISSRHKDGIFVGYNRPFSGAIRDLHRRLPGPRGPMTLSCFISGHRIPADHWYRNPEEGTRICGNVGHWLDLAVHMLHWRNLPDLWRISLSWSDPGSRDDDMAISLTSDAGDLVNIVLTARNEPFEGINETLNVQWDDVIAKIDDFRSMTVWQGEKLKKFRYWPKDVGHKRAVLQPFRSETRPWGEIELSSLLMLRIADMVRSARAESDFSFSGEISALRSAESS